MKALTTLGGSARCYCPECEPSAIEAFTRSCTEDFRSLREVIRKVAKASEGAAREVHGVSSGRRGNDRRARSKRLGYQRLWMRDDA